MTDGKSAVRSGVLRCSQHLAAGHLLPLGSSAGCLLHLEGCGHRQGQGKRQAAREEGQIQATHEYAGRASASCCILKIAVVTGCGVAAVVLCCGLVQHAVGGVQLGAAGATATARHTVAAAAAANPGYSQSPGIHVSVALLISLFAWALVNQPLFTMSWQFWYTDLPFLVGPTAVKVATDWWLSTPLWPSTFRDTLLGSTCNILATTPIRTSFLPSTWQQQQNACTQQGQDQMLRYSQEQVDSGTATLVSEPGR